MANASQETLSDDDIGGGTSNVLSSGAGTKASGGAMASGAISGTETLANATAEIKGDAPVPAPAPTEAGGEADPEAEVGNLGGSEGAALEATPEQLAAESGEESAVSDLRGIEGFEEVTAAEAAEAAEASAIPEVGTLLEEAAPADAAEFGFLASLIPTLISTVGPPLAKAIGGRLRPKTKARVQKRGKGKPAAGGGKRDQILALIARLLESAEAAPASESGGQLDEALVTAAVGAIESIIGTDDRVRITNTTAIPWRRFCALKIQFPLGKFVGTGWMLGPRAVCTAGHCVYLKRAGGWATSVEVIPGAIGTQSPFGKAVSTQFRSVVGWVNQGRPESDYGCIVLPPGAFGGRNLGAFGFANFTDQQLLAAPAVLAGYPGDKPFGELWGMSRKIASVTPQQLRYQIDTMGGQSGSPVYIKRNNQRYVVGIHNYGGTTQNSATRITASIYQRLVAWRQL